MGGHVPAKIKRQTASSDEVVFVSEKAGYNILPQNCINQAQRLALQQQIDEESQPTISFRSLVGGDTNEKKMVAKKKGMVKKEEHSVETSLINEGCKKSVKKKMKAEAAVENQTASNRDGGKAVEDKMKGQKSKMSTGSQTGIKGEEAKVTNFNNGGSIQKKKKKKSVDTNSLKTEEMEHSQVQEEKGEVVNRHKKGADSKCVKTEEEMKPSEVKEEKAEVGNRQKKKKGTDSKHVKTEEMIQSEVKEDKGVNNGQKKKKKCADSKPVKKEEEVTLGDVKEEKRGVDNRQKKKNHYGARKVEISLKDEEAEDGEEAETKKKKKKKATVAQDDKVEIKEVKKKKILQAVKPREDTWKELVVEKVKKKKKRVESEIGEVEKEVVVKKKRPKSSNNPETSERDEEESKMVKRQKKEKREAFASTKEKALVEEEVPKKKKKIHSNGGEKQALMEEEVPKKKKKFHSNEGEKQVGDGETKGMFAVDSCNKAKKLKKCASAVEIETQKESPMMSGKKVKIETVDKGNRKIKVENFDPEEQEAELQNDVVFLSETKGNKDEINIDQARRLALQNEIDVKSNPVQPKVELGLGQWGTAQFDSSDQQNKFLRLMGGFKKGGQPMGAKGATTAVRANMALTKDGQQSMQQKLLGEFERAQSRRMDFTGRAAGLGFSAPSNKKFSIDVNATRSVRFDD